MYGVIFWGSQIRVPCDALCATNLYLEGGTALEEEEILQETFSKNKVDCDRCSIK